MSGDDTYAPKSPDLSSFYAAGPTPPAEPSEPQQLFLSQRPQPNFSHLQSPSLSYFPNSHHQQPRAPDPNQHYQFATPTQQQNLAPSQVPGLGVGVGYPSAAQHEYYPPRAASYPTVGYSQLGTGYTATQAPQHHQPPFYQPPYRGGSLQFQYSQPQQAPPHLTAAHAHAQSGPPAYEYHPEPATAAGPNLNPQYQPNPPDHHPDAMPPRRAAAAAAAAAAAQMASEDSTAGPLSASPGAIEAAPVKTKFPTARIKRIMQADEEVGKVAQQTPIAVGKALEMFMIAMVTKSAEVARQRNSKRVSAQMLKHVVESDDQWDFLRDIVGKVEGEDKGGKGAAAAGKVKAESDTDEEGGSGGPAAAAADAGAAAGGKRKRGGGRKKKAQ